MNNAIRCFNRAAFALAMAFFPSAHPARAQFPAYPPSSVTNAQGRDQMMRQLGRQKNAAEKIAGIVLPLNRSMGCLNLPET